MVIHLFYCDYSPSWSYYTTTWEMRTFYNFSLEACEGRNMCCLHEEFVRATF